MKTEFVVEAIEQRYGRIDLKVRKYYPPKPPEPETAPPPPPDPLETFVPKTKEEKFTIGFLKTLRELGLDPLPPRTVYAPRPICVPFIESTISLTINEYKTLGKPGLGQRITMELEKTKEES